MFKYFFLVSFLMTSACAMTPKKVPPTASPEPLKKEFARIRTAAIKTKSSKSLDQLSAFAKNHADTDLADDANMTLGEIYCSQKQYEACSRSYLEIINSEYISPHEIDAVIAASRALLELERNDEVIGLTQRALHADNLNKDNLVTIYGLRLQALAKTGDRLEALRALGFLAENAPNDEQRSRSRLKAIELIRSIDDPDVLKKVATDNSFGNVRAEALFRVGLIEFEARDYSDAENYLQEVVKIAPDSQLAFQSKSIIEQIEARRRVDPMTIGAVLPLSGKYQSIGYKTLRGLELGLGITGNNSSSFKLAVVDSVGNPDMARRGVERLVIEDSVIAVVGDISSRASDEVAEKADELGLPNVSLAQKTALPNSGPYIFRNALTSEALVKELVRAAMEDQGLKSFAILYPNDPYGVEYANIFWDEVEARGGEIRGAQAYDTTSRDFVGAIQRLVGTYYIEPREQELNYMLKDWYSKQKVINSRTKAPDDLLTPVVDFDAVFIPDSISNLAQVASMLIYNDIQDIRLLGTNLWNTSSLVKKGTKLIDQAVFVDAASSVNNNLKNSKFYQLYKATYNEEPSVFEAQAYDTGLALRQAIVSGARSRSSLRDALLNLRSFPGSVGEVSIQANQEFSRPLVALTVTDGQILPLTKTPESLKK